MNPAVTPMRNELEDWLPMPVDVAGIVHDYLGNPFVTLWEVREGGTLRLPLVRRTGEVFADNFFVSWGDGMSNHIQYNDDYAPGDATHLYSAAGQYRVHITGTIRGFCFGGSVPRYRDIGVPVQDCCELLQVSQWGCLQLLNGRRAFGGCSKLTVTARDAPGLKDAKDLSEMFSGCVSLREEDFRSWDTSDVTSMHGMFIGCKQFDGNVSTWETSNVTDMSRMFEGCFRFNGDLSHWKTGCVTDMNRMFSECVSFNVDLSRWATGYVETIEKMFFKCVSFRGGGLQSWDTSRVKDMKSVFTGCVVFNGDLRTWFTGSVVAMDRMFNGCCSFRGGDLRNWRTHRVTSMKEMFMRCRSFEGDLSNWNTGACENMERMFQGCCSFNGDLRRWDTSKIVYACYMFLDCVSFKGDLSAWDIGNLSCLDRRKGRDFESIIDDMCGGLIPQAFRPSRRGNLLRSGKRWRPSDYEEERNSSQKFNQWMLRKPGSPTPYEEERRQNIARNQEMLRSIMGPVGPTKYTRGQESAGTASETPGETALVILRSPAGNTERALGGAWGTPAAFVQSLARCGMSLNPAAVN